MAAGGVVVLAASTFGCWGWGPGGFARYEYEYGDGEIGLI
jgi:hypothetical protein